MSGHFDLGDDHDATVGCIADDVTDLLLRIITPVGRVVIGG